MEPDPEIPAREAEFQEKLVELLQSFSNQAIESIGAEDKIMSTGLIDSINIVEIIILVEQYWGLQVDPTELSMDNFDSIGAIKHYVRRKLNGEL